jgi:peptidoglycan biosynthesis protein MviN/MurJ (putative lipid II flippase)
VSKSLKHIGVVAAVTMLSRVLGLGRDMLVTAVFGMSALASAFYTAFTLPNLFRRLLGEGALTAALVPTLNEELRHRGRAGGFVLLNQVASWLLLVTGLLTAGAMLGLSRFGAAVLSFIVNLALSLALMRPLGTLGLAVAGNLAVAVQAIYLQHHLSRRHPGLAFRKVGLEVVKIVLASGLMGLVVAAGAWGWAVWVPRNLWSDLGGLAGLIGGGMALYAALLWGLKIEGRRDVAALLGQLRARFAS